MCARVTFDVNFAANLPIIVVIVAAAYIYTIHIHIFFSFNFIMGITLPFDCLFLKNNYYSGKPTLYSDQEKRHQSPGKKCDQIKSYIGDCTYEMHFIRDNGIDDKLFAVRFIFSIKRSIEFASLEAQNQFTVK